jgi:autotransporter-associated beta strand protein
MTGDAVISVGLPGDSAGNEFLIGPISGTGNLTKIGPGRLAMEEGPNTFSGSLTVAEGEVQTRTNKAVNDLFIAEGATFTQIGQRGLNQAPENSTTVNGTLNLNNRGTTDDNAFSVNIGTLLGGPSGQIISTSEAALQTMNVTSDVTNSLFEGQILGSVALVKAGNADLTLSGNSDYDGTTQVQAGTLTLTGSLQSGELTIESAGTLAGTGAFNGALTVVHGTLAPGVGGIGTLPTDSQQWHGGARLELEFGDMAGTHGSDWDFLQLNGDLDLDPSLTPALPIQISLSGAAANFDAGSPGSWKILESQQVSPSFSADLFSIDASALAIDAWVASDQFSISESGGDLYLDYSPAVPYAVWIGRYALGEDTAFASDTDGDGIPHGVEGGLGTNPGAHTTGMFEDMSLPLAGQMTFTHPYQNPSPVSDVELHYRWSTDLETFHASGHSDGETEVVFTRQADDPEAGVATVTATITGTIPDTLFITLEAVQVSP